MVEIAVNKPTVKRFINNFLFRKGMSILRCLEYEFLASIKFEGRVLDFGGGKKAKYANQINSTSKAGEGFIFQSANINEKVEPTYLISENNVIPVTSNSFDAVISLNTFEHIYHWHRALKEVVRVLKPQGELIIAVPFIYRVHGHPDDYFRGTPSFWGEALRECGLENVEVEALNWGPFSTAQTVSGTPGPFKELRQTWALLLDLIYFSFKKTYTKVSQESYAWNAPLGYLIRAKKP